ncbi:hypothetical protein QN277_008983 [Acacia crassicarpa]|uniref:Uncharacterized protein n=1 Tax=Acacia crassicarpa TaxID=499986 RepID=A0AAE1JR02_9FABA|nr:hypothetical protein QN277_008983 [Acacia crassicarpa]
MNPLLVLYILTVRAPGVKVVTLGSLQKVRCKRRAEFLDLDNRVCKTIKIQESAARKRMFCETSVPTTQPNKQDLLSMMATSPQLS